MKGYDTAMIGGGIVGLATAKDLVRARASIRAQAIDASGRRRDDFRGSEPNE